MSDLKPMSGETLELTKKNIDKLKELFPEVLTENQIDFEKLRLILGDEVNDKPEKYSFTWNGKNNAIKIAQQPSTGTLRPNKENSKNWDTTENLFIEGDNLEALKLLQKFYAGKVKIIYIDPPYNTGKDFVYKDDFKDNLQNYFKQTGQVDDDGNKLATNTESSGRFHTDWLNMMYPRLILMKNLLTDDGVIYISIDENESDNLRKILDEIFGEDNRLSTQYIQVRYSNKSLNEKNDWQPVVEQVYIYAKNKKNFTAKKPEQEYSYDKFIYEIEELTEGVHTNLGGKDTIIFPKNEWKIKKHKKGSEKLLKETWASGSVISGNSSGKFSNSYITPRAEKNNEYGYLYKVEGIGEDGLGYRYFTGPSKPGNIRGKFFSGVPTDRLEEAEEGTSIKYSPIPNYYDFSGDFGNIRHEGEVAFNDGKKPVRLLEQLFNYTHTEDAIILDAFAGSSSTAHTVMNMNSKDNMNRKFIMIQLPEVAEDNSDAKNAGYDTIAELGIDRIKKSGEKILENSKYNIDVGFKNLKLDNSNIQKWNIDSENIEESLFSMENNFVEGRSHTDIVYEILLKLGLNLNIHFAESTVGGSTVYDVAFGNVYIVLGENITQEVAKYIANKQKEYENENPSVVFNDNGFKNDNEKLNSIEILKNNGFNEEQLMSI
ncbi:MAG: site-specific DNA-methyltransferase [Tissierella sp.]|uniref:site-specific DNA-methyltransferase n=1 Tax=Bacillota TaxID=1239 RepID=UPI000EE62566|nr:site-specific DNA-methyltransferase [Aerococcaceae bacterium]